MQQTCFLAKFLLHRNRGCQKHYRSVLSIHVYNHPPFQVQTHNHQSLGKPVFFPRARYSTYTKLGMCFSLDQSLEFPLTNKQAMCFSIDISLTILALCVYYMLDSTVWNSSQVFTTCYWVVSGKSTRENQKVLGIRLKIHVGYM